MKYEFTPDCKLGVPQIDSEHQHLFSIMNKIMETLEAEKEKTESGHAPGNAGSIPGEEDMHGLEEYVEMLLDYGKNHFAHEEEYMEKINDPELPRQKREHAMFIQKMNMLDFQDLSNSEKRGILADTLKYLTKWLYGHILGSDTMIGKIVHISEQAKEGEELCLFTEKYMTGIEEIDNEHRKLFDIIGEAFQLVENNNEYDIYDETMHILDELEDYTKTHFAHEEEYMKSVNYPDLRMQQRAHTVFLEKLEDKDLGENYENQREFLEEMLDFLYAWLGRHILQMDKKIGEYKK